MPRAIQAIVVLKCAIAASAAGLLLWDRVLRARGRKRAFRRLRDCLLAGLGAASFAAGGNFGLFHLDHYLHLWDIYHYYVGSKYAPELGYTRLYSCAALAEADLGHRDTVIRRSYRELTSNRIRPATEALSNPSDCLNRFSPARWNAFRLDIDWFRGRMGLARWSAAQLDHGYNPTPAWTMAGTALTNLSQASDRSIFLLALLDPMLIVAMWAAAIWAFGWRAACVALVFWGTNFGSDFGWVGGAFLRMDWLFLTVLSIALLRRQRPFGAGFALAWAALLRIFPGFLFGGCALKIAVASYRQRRLAFSREDLRFMAGGAVAALVLGLISTVGTSESSPSLRAWSGFVANSEKHLSSLSLNNIGLKTALSWVPEEPMTVAPGEDVPTVWWEPHRRAVELRRPLFLALAAGFAALLCRAVDRRPLWIASILSVGLVPVFATVSCYYAAVLLLYGLLWPRSVPGIAICTLGALSNVFALTARWGYENYVLFSLATIVVATAITYRFTSGETGAASAGAGARPSR